MPEENKHKSAGQTANDNNADQAREETRPVNGPTNPNEAEQPANK